jgi:hypothetical protein
MNNVTYDVLVSVDLAKAVEPVADMVKHLNDALATFGGSEQVTVRSGEFRLWTLTSGSELSTEDIKKMKTTIDAAIRDNGNLLGIRVSDIRKSSNQSCSKST